MPYSSVAQYIARYGEREATLLTNATPPGAGEVPSYDSAKIDGALEAAGEVVDSFVGKRYVTPITDPPRIVVGWVQALAREELHVNTGRTNETVTASADRVRSQLLQVSRGDLVLPIAVGATAPVPVDGSLGYAASSLDRGPAPFSNGALDDFTAGLGGYSPFVGCWRR